ncbi:hypothetical protein KKG16_00905, partial [Patescibacteria group bacterium]|nr:hypothetical protein [Patescibacteria group bacterium]
KTSRSDTFEESELRPREGQVNEDMKIIGIKVPREELVERINRRTSEMIKNGWVEEVRGLLEKGYKYKDPGMKSCGYREIINAINSDIAVETPCGASLIETIAAKTRQYARRQVCWWRNDRRISWINYGKVACHPKSKRPARP